MVWRDDIEEPTSVTYGFSPFPHDATFKNLNDLPVLPFSSNSLPRIFLQEATEEVGSATSAITSSSPSLSIPAVHNPFDRQPPQPSAPPLTVPHAELISEEEQKYLFNPSNSTPPVNLLEGGSHIHTNSDLYPPPSASHHPLHDQSPSGLSSADGSAHGAHRKRRSRRSQLPRQPSLIMSRRCPVHSFDPVRQEDAPNQPLLIEPQHITDERSHFSPLLPDYSQDTLDPYSE